MRTFGTDITAIIDNIHPVASGVSGRVEYFPQAVQLPLPPSLGDEHKFEMEIYVRFMRHLREVPASRMEVKILSAIQFTADIMDHGDALVAKMLVDMGLRAPRRAFPLSFLEFADKSIARAAWKREHALPETIASLKSHWDKIGEDRFTNHLEGHNASRFGTVSII